MNNWPKVRFHSHAFISIETESALLFCDPWFFGDVFNESWSLLVEPDSENLNYEKLTHIWVSHEHPDHFHLASLRKIRSRAYGPLKFLYRQQPNQNVRQVASNIGFETIELLPGQPFKLASDLEVTSIPQAGDCALVIRAHDRIIFNQNDCQLSKNKARQVQLRFAPIDVWFFQFSLAGYYANQDDHEGLKNAKEKHLRMIRDYYEVIEPKIYVPFASFVYFSKTTNKYLNNYRVTLEDIHRHFPDIPLQILWRDNLLSWQQDSGVLVERNSENLVRWHLAYQGPVKIKEPCPASEEDLIRAGKVFASKSRRNSYFWCLPAETIFLLSDLDRVAVLNLRKGIFEIREKIVNDVYAGILPSEEFLFFLKFPWGADTLNITGAFEIKNHFQWRWVTYTKHCQYVFMNSKNPLNLARPLIGAAVRSVQAWLSIKSLLYKRL